MARRALVGAAVLVGAAIAIVFFLPGLAGPADAQGDRAPLTTPAGFTNAEFELRVYSNGSTRWIVRASRPLDNQSEIDRFRSFGDTFESTETEAFRNFKLRARRLVDFGANATGREMNATRFDRSARVVELGQTRGVVELSFLWTGFARTDGQRVVVDDVFDGGMFVDEGQRLIVSRGSDLVFQSVAPPPDSQSVEGNLTASETVTWLGKRDFADNRPRVVLVPPEQVVSDPGSPDGSEATATPTPAGQSDQSGRSILWVIVALVVIGLGGGFALYSGAVGGFGRSPDEGGESEPQPDSESDVQPRQGVGIPDEEFLSDEERVLQLLDDHDGRMKQVEIVDETDWSKSKVSMVLSDMEDDGQISKLRVGRENIISKAGEEPDAAGSPFEEE